MLKIKAGVTPKNLVCAAAVANVAELRGITLVITSGTDGVHKRGSKHYLGDAVDVRTRGVKDVAGVVVDLRKRLGRRYDVIVESDHIHIEYDPK